PRLGVRTHPRRRQGGLVRVGSHLMNVWFCTACGTPSGSLAERCLHCGAPRPGAQPGAETPVTAPPMTGPVPLAQYEVFAPQPEAYAPPQHQSTPPPGAVGWPQPE